MRHLIVCCDGTWNSAEQRTEGVPTPTNVRLFFNALAGADAQGHEQRARYFSGVGADGSAVSRAIEGGTGLGLSRNIMNAYLWLAGNYAPGDRIAAVGFSRGAYTARSLVGMLTTCGLLGDDGPVAWDDVQRLFHAGYVPGPERRAPGWADGLGFHPGFGPPASRPEQVELGRHVEFVGVWDTVGALGVPDTLGLLDLVDDERRYAFHDTSLNAGVGCARHAIALDERRGAFAPTLWTTADGDPVPNDDRVVQMWFPGCHSDVGGGYRETGLSDGALLWMVGEARAAVGLGFRDRALGGLCADPDGVLHDSCVGVYERLSPVPRSVPAVCQGAGAVHVSALSRATDPPIRQDRYRPTHLLAPGECATREVFAHEAWGETGLYLEAGTYAFDAAGRWVDREVEADPDGIGDPPFLSRIAYAAGSVIGQVELAYRRGTANPSAEFFGAKRYPEGRWMQLVGVVANGGFDARGSARRHQAVLLGAARTEVRVHRPGYLYAFANDAWGMYANNRGSVTLTVTRLGPGGA